MLFAVCVQVAIHFHDESGTGLARLPLQAGDDAVQVIRGRDGFGDCGGRIHVWCNLGCSDVDRDFRDSRVLTTHYQIDVPLCTQVEWLKYTPSLSLFASHNDLVQQACSRLLAQHL